MIPDTLPLRRLLPRLLAAAAILLIVGYGLFEARRLIEGPQITITAPRDGQATSGPTVTITGTAHNVTFLWINGKQAYVDQSDHFEETLSPPPGYTVLMVSGKDRFGRTAAKTIHLTINNFCSAES